MQLQLRMLRMLLAHCYVVDCSECSLHMQQGAGEEMSALMSAAPEAKIEPLDSFCINF